MTDRTWLVGTGYGRVVALDVGPDAVSDVRDALPHWWTPADAGAVPEEVFRVDEARLAEFEVSMVELWIAEHAVDRVFVHAAAVGWHGRALLLPGRSGTGKTSLTAALLRAGATYLSDEYAVLDPDGRVHAYPRPLSMRQDDGTRLPMPPAEFGAVTETAGPLPVGAVALLRYDANASWQVAPITAAAAVLGLLDNTVAAREATDRLLATLTAAAADAIVIEGVRGDSAAAAVSLLREAR